MNAVHLELKELSLRTIPSRPPERSVLFVRPTYYDVLYEINPHMAGNIGTVNKERAMQQWNTLTETYQKLGYQTNIIDGVTDLPDMVFCANQSFPFLQHDGTPAALLSQMASAFRSDEVEHIARWYQTQNYKIIRQAKPYATFEGMGDAIWHPEKRLVYIGYGFRTSKEALQRIASGLDFTVIGLELVQPHFYHLDTALSVIDQQTAIYVKEAFSAEGIRILQHMFPRLIQVPLAEAKYGFVTNGHCPDGKNFIVQQGNTQTRKALEAIGLTIWEVDTSEFMKSGGSVFCMKMMLP